MDLRTTPPDSPIFGLDAVDPAASNVQLPSRLRRQLTRMVELGYPFEVCGLMLGHQVGGQVVVEQVLHARNLNISRLRDRYELDPDDFLGADRVARASGLEIVGIWHSHPDAPARPSSTDLERAWEGYSYLILSVTAKKVLEFRSWRLRDGRFLEENVTE